MISINNIDRAVLEMHHASASWQMIMEKQNNIFKNLSIKDLARVRERTIAMVLATDMTNHFSDHARLKNRLNSQGIIVLLILSYLIF